MQDFARLLEIVYTLFNREFCIYGFDISFWQIFMFVVLGTMVAYAIVEIFR